MKTNQIIIILAILVITVGGLFFILSGKTNTVNPVNTTNNTSDTHTSTPGVTDESQPHDH